MKNLKIHETIAYLRKQKKVSQKDLATALGVSDQAVSKWESAQCCPDIQLLPEIADYFGVSIDMLFGRQPEYHAQNDDELLERARVIVAESGQMRTSLLQRKLNIGYTKAKKLIQLLEETPQ